jgi:ferredoxin-NADP reductase
MARAAVSRRLTWRVAQLTETREETASARTLVFEVPGWPGHLPGQHVDVRLTAADGYSTQRSYSLAAPADGDRVELTVQNVPDGEVSSYLAEGLTLGDAIEIRGPVGGWFVWRPSSPSPVLLVAGGSGIVPLMAMIRAHRQAGAPAPFRLVYSVRTPGDRYYSGELSSPHPGLDVTHLYTRETPSGWSRPPGRLTAADLTVDVAANGSPGQVDCFVCGPTGFVETASGILLDLGHDARRIKTERFGPSGG